MLDNNGISILNKGKILALTNGIKAYNKEILGEEIYRLTATNTQLMNNKLNIKIAKTKLEADKVKLISEKNIFVVKREELRAELIKTIATFITSIQTSIIIVYDKLKAKRLPLVNETKETFQRFFIGTYYYYRFYNQSLFFDSNKI